MKTSFDYLNKSNAHGIKIAIADFVKKELEILSETKKLTPWDINRLDRKEWAKKFLVYQKENSKQAASYIPLRKVSTKEELFHIARFIDICLPKHYCILKGIASTEFDIKKHPVLKHIYNHSVPETNKKKTEQATKNKPLFPKTPFMEEILEPYLKEIDEKRKKEQSTKEQIKFLQALHKEVYKNDLADEVLRFITDLRKKEVSDLISCLQNKKRENTSK